MNSLRPKSMLRAYQRYLAAEIKRRKYSLLAVDMGLGKTASVLCAIRDLFDALKIRKVLIIAPKRVAVHTWPDEIKEWDFSSIMSYSVVVGTPKQREEAFAADVLINIINRENLPWLRKKLEDSGDFPYDMIVYDESSRLKAWSHKTSKDKLSEFGSLASFRSKVSRIVLLSGTCAPNGLRDLGGQSYILDLGKRLGSSKTAFFRRWFHTDRENYICEPHPWAHKEIMSRLKDVMICLRAQDYIQLPKLIHNSVYIDLPEALMKQYRQFEQDMVSIAYDVEAVSRGVLTNKLLQFSNGFMYRNIEGSEPPRRELVKIHEEKIKVLESIIEEAAGKNILVAYNYEYDLELLKKKFPHAVVFDDDEGVLRRWNDGKIQLLLAHPASVGHGLNLQKGGHVAVWYGLTWSLELYQQFNKRLHRTGQESDKVFIHHILCRGTVDDTVMKVMRRKGVTQDNITDQVRKRILDSVH